MTLCLSPFTLPGGAPAPKIRGSLPPLPPPPVRRHDAPCEAGRRRTALCRRRFGESLPTRFQCGFSGTTWTTTAGTSPSERGALGLLKGRATSCATYARHPPSGRVTPIRRHVLDPRRRKSSIMSRPLEAGFSCSYWTIFSMTTSKPPWRSTVSCPRNPQALPGRVGFSGPWHAGTPQNASCTDFRLRDRRCLHRHRSRVARRSGAPERRARRGQRGRRRTA